MTRSSMIFYLMVSMLIHAGMVLLLRNCRYFETAAPEKTVQVEVVAIREIPMISMEPASPPPVAESFRFPPAAVAGAGAAAGAVKPPEFLPAMSSPTLDLHAGMDAVSTAGRRFPETVPNRPVAGDGTRDRESNTVNPPESLPAMSSPTLDFHAGMDAVSTAGRRSPETVSNLPAADDRFLDRESNTVKPPESLTSPLSPSAAFPRAMVAVSSSKRHSPATVPPPPVEGISESAARPSTASPVAFESRLASLSPRSPAVLPENDAPVLYEPPARPPEFYFPGSPGGAAFLLLVDTSGSVRGDPLEGIKRSAKVFVGLMGEDDRAAIMTFDDKVSSLAGFTSEKALLRSRIEKLDARGQRTLLFDGLMEAAADIRQEDRLKRHVFLFSDGKDEGSRADRDEVLRALVASDISVFAVGFTRVEKQYLDTLRQFAEKTGGIFVQTPEFREMLALYESTGPAPETRSEDEENIVYLMVTSDPPDARIVIDGKFRGNAPITLSIPAGKHEILIEKEGFFVWEAQLHLEHGRQRISPSLVSKDER